MAYIIEGLVEGQWDWRHVSDSVLNATFATEDAALEALRELADTCDWDEGELRVRSAASSG